MKNIFSILLFSIISNFLIAQNDSIQWFENMEDAKMYATDHQSDILVIFAGSDWCRPCIQFKKDILEVTDFQAWGEEKIVILYLDFPARRKNKLSTEQTAHNEALAEQFNKSGVFPNIFLVNTNTEILANPKFNGQSVADFISNLESSLTDIN